VFTPEGVQFVKLTEVVKRPVDWNTKTEKQQIAMVKRAPQSIAKITNPSEVVQWAAINQNTFAIQYIKNPSEAAQLAAVSRNGFLIEQIKNPSEAVQLAAVSADALAIQYIKNPSEAAQLAAVSRNEWAIWFIDNPTPKVIKLVLQSPSVINNQRQFEDFIHKLFADNAIMTKKWLMYGKTMRSQG
jgi:hypothetical protein